MPFKDEKERIAYGKTYYQDNKEKIKKQSRDYKAKQKLKEKK